MSDSSRSTRRSIDPNLLGLTVAVITIVGANAATISMMSNSLRNEMDTRFNAVDQRLDGIDNRLDGIDGRLERMDGQLYDLNGRVARVESGVFGYEPPIPLESPAENELTPSSETTPTSEPVAAMAVEEGVQAPDFTLPSIYEGRPDISLSGLAGKVVYIDFWASWCAPCLTSLPLYNDLYHRYRDQGLEVLGITVDDPIEDGLEFLADTPLDFPIPADPEGEVMDLYAVFGMPTSYLIGRDGEVKLVHTGFRDGDIEEIENAIQEALAGG